jgi:hypothetical protein
MTTAFQILVDYAESISINRRKKVSQTVSRDGFVRSTSLGGQTWEFEITLPNGPRWSDFRGLIERLEALDRVTVGTIKFNKSGQEYISQYLGTHPNTSLIDLTVPASPTNTVTINTTSPISSGFYFKAGDWVQLGTGSVYSVAADVPGGTTSVTLNRAIRDASGSYQAKVGPNAEFKVICIQFPQWTIFGRNQVSWSGPFILAEAL